MDFGLAREVDRLSRISAAGIEGTPCFMAPEQVRGEARSLDRRTDVYGLGSTLYSILCGRPPFFGKTADVLLDVMNSEPPPMHQFDPTIPSDLEAIVLRCLAKEQRRRYPSAKALAGDLRRFLSGARIDPRPDSGAYGQAEGTLRRMLLAAGAVMVLLAVLTVGAAVVHARLTAAEQARQAQQVGQELTKMEWQLRSARQLPLHDLTQDTGDIRKRMRQLQADLRRQDAPSRGLSHYALGRSHLALHEYPDALAQLQLAVQHGNHSPEVHYALGIALGKRFEQELSAERLTGGNRWAQEQRSELARTYLVPAIASLARGRARKNEISEYLEALIAFYSQDDDAALAHAARALKESPWLFEAAKLQGDVHYERALRAHDRGDDEEAQKELSTAIHDYESAVAIGQSDAELYESLAEAWVRQVELSEARSRPAEAAYAQAAAAGDKVAVADPENASGLLKKATAAMLILTSARPSPAAGPQPKECLAAADAVLKHEPGNPHATIAAAACHAAAAERARTRGGDPEPLWARALQLAQDAVRRTPRLLRGLDEISAVYAARGVYRAAHGNPGARQDLESSLSYSLLVARLDEESTLSWQHLLGSLSELVTVLEPAESARDLIPLADDALRGCQATNRPHHRCTLSYGVFYARLAQRSFAAGADPRKYLTAARAQFAELKRLGASSLIAERNQALLHYVDASQRSARNEDPAPALSELAAALERCFALSRHDAQCRTLAAQADWLAAAELTRSNKPFLPVLKDALGHASMAGRDPDHDADSFWVLAETHLRMASAELDKPVIRDRHVARGLAAIGQVLAVNPHHDSGRATQAALLRLPTAADTAPHASSKGKAAASPRYPLVKKFSVAGSRW